MIKAPSIAAGIPSKAVTPRKGFGITAWFKRGELEVEVAKAVALAAETDTLAVVRPPEAVVVEAGLTSADHARLTLDGAAANTAPVRSIVAAAVEDRMSPEEMYAELNTSRRRIIVAGVIIGVSSVLLTVYFLFLR